MIARALCPVLVGREDELSALEDALLAACRGEGSVIVLAGDAGMGKTRLCGELERRARKIGASVMEGSCSEAELALPYLPFLEAIGNYLETTDDAALAERLGVHATQLATLFPQLGVSGATSDGSPDARLRLFEAVLALLHVAAEQRGLLLIVEDLHWADASTRELLDYLTRRLRNTRVLVLATYRRDEMHRKHPLLPTLQSWQRSRLAQIVELDPLPADGVGQMVSAIFDDSSVSGEFRDFLHVRSEGNPFVLEEMLKAALDRGDIYREEGGWQRKPLRELRIPDTVRDSILLRLDRLDPKQVEILRCASVLGRSFDYQTLIEVAGEDRATVERALEAAALQQLLEKDTGAVGRYRFRHALTQESVYDDLSAPMQERLHSAAAEALGDRPDAIAETAYHLRAAHRWDEAVPATMRAAELAEQHLGYREAARLYQLLLPVVTQGVERGRLLCRLGETLWRGTDLKEALGPLLSGVQALRDAGQEAEAAPHLLTLGRVNWEGGNVDAAGDAYEQARDILEPLGPSPALALAYVRLAGMACFAFDGANGERLARRAMEIADACGATDMEIWAQQFLGLALSAQGDAAGGTRLMEQSAERATALDLHEIAGNALANLTVTYEYQLQLDKMPALVERLRGIPVGRYHLAALYTQIAWAMLTGRAEDALAAAGELYERAQLAGSGFYTNNAVTGHVQALTLLDRLPKAKEWFVGHRAIDTQSELTHLELELMINGAEGADPERSIEPAERVLALKSLMGWEDSSEYAIAAFIAAGRLEEAEELVTRLDALPAPAARATAKAARARLLLARGDAAGAEARAREAFEYLERAGALARAGRARLVLADALVALNRPQEAETALRAQVEVARKRALKLLERQARERLGALGVDLEDREPPPGPSVPDVPNAVGERLVTVLFADIRGYTALSGDTAPAELVDKIAAYQRWAAQEVERHLGHIDKFAGDAVMATFNVSGSQVDHALHALKTAQALRDKAALLGLPVGIGIATGAAVVGRLKEGANVSVLGTATNLAARLQSEARPGQILISEETYRRVSEHSATREELELKGFSEPVTAYRLPA